MARTRAPLFDTGISKRIWSEFERGVSASLLDMVSFVVVVVVTVVMPLLAVLNPETLGMSMADNRTAVNKPMDFLVDIFFVDDG